MSGDLLLLRYSDPVTIFYSGLILSVTAGICCLWQMPMTIKKRVVLTTIFVPVGIAVLVFYSLWFEGAILGDGI